MEVTAQQIRALTRNALVIEVDLRDVSAIRPAVARVEEELGAIDILVNNAGVNQVEPSMDVTLETWDRLNEVNLRAPFFCAQAVAKGMLERGSGKIINIASDAGQKGFGDHAAYAATKGGLIQLTRDLAVEWAPRGIQVNAVAPGACWTDMAVSVMQNPERAAAILARGASPRLTDPEEVAAAVVYLASREADQVIGHVLNVDGGSCAR